MHALWRTGLLLSLCGYSACSEEECILGEVGHPVLLPCIYDGPKLEFSNVSIEWRRDNELLFRSVWEEARHVDMWEISSTNTLQVSADAPQTGNFSLELSTVKPTEPYTHYSLFLIISGAEQRPPLCTVCLRAAASFTFPAVQRLDPAEGEETVLMCHSIAGFPQTTVHWLVNRSGEPPEGSVRTVALPLPNSTLYNITSRLSLNVSRDTSVSCVVENLAMNETLTSTSYGVKLSPLVSRAAEAMWIFSTVLCVVVGVMVLVALAYQIHLDRTQKKRYLDKGYKNEDTAQTADIDLERVDCLLETNV